MNDSQYDNTSREMIAATQHAIWAHWMDYLFDMCDQNPDGSYTIPKHLADRWQRQMNTSYEDLSEEEKKSDRQQADKIFDTLNKAD